MDIYATELMGAKNLRLAGIMLDACANSLSSPRKRQSRLSLPAIRGHFQPLVPNTTGCVGGGGKMELSVSERALALYEPNESWLAVRRICWITDHRYPAAKGRACNDVDLTPFRTNGNVETASDASRCGAAGAVRRLLQGWCLQGRSQLQSRLPQSAIRWSL